MKRKKKRRLSAPEAWAKRNAWFGKDSDLTYRAFDTHTQLIKLGVNPRTKLYYSLIDLIMFPYIIKKRNKLTKEKKIIINNFLKVYNQNSSLKYISIA